MRLALLALLTTRLGPTTAEGCPDNVLEAKMAACIEGEPGVTACLDAGESECDCFQKIQDCLTPSCWMLVQLALCLGHGNDVGVSDIGVTNGVSSALVEGVASDDAGAEAGGELLDALVGDPEGKVRSPNLDGSRNVAWGVGADTAAADKRSAGNAHIDVARVGSAPGATVVAARACDGEVGKRTIIGCLKSSLTDLAPEDQGLRACALLKIPALQQCLGPCLERMTVECGTGAPEALSARFEGGGGGGGAIGWRANVRSDPVAALSELDNIGDVLVRSRCSFGCLSRLLLQSCSQSTTFVCFLFSQLRSNLRAGRPAG
jgi:hypothetical protein